MSHPTDDFDERLRRAASDYNRPGEAPRERMWAEIRAQRAQRVVAAPVAPTHRRRLWVVPAAAAAVLVLGIAIGRIYEHLQATTSSRPLNTAHLDSARTPAGIQSIDSTSKAESLSKTVTRQDVAEAPSKHAVPRDKRTLSDSLPNATTTAYRLAVVEHLAGTEAMLTSFRAAAKRGEVDAQITTWARNLLTTTRLLEASAAQEDPTMKRLLDDLELVLVQIAQYTSAGPHRAEELELIEHSIERRGVIGKLHTTIPARLGPAGT
jgi:hypothetical protein